MNVRMIVFSSTASLEMLIEMDHLGFVGCPHPRGERYRRPRDDRSYPPERVQSYSGA